MLLAVLFPPGTWSEGYFSSHLSEGPVVQALHLCPRLRLLNSSTAAKGSVEPHDHQGEKRLLVPAICLLDCESGGAVEFTKAADCLWSRDLGLMDAMLR